MAKKQFKNILDTLARSRCIRVFLLIIIGISAVGMVVSVIFLMNWMVENQNTNNLTDTVVEDADLTSVASDENDMTESSDDNSFNPYWDFNDTDYLAANFDQLHQVNPEIIAWISMSSVNVNYPVAQHADNDFYLNHTIDRSKNNAGWIFMDYRNQSFRNADSYDRNTIIYAHNRQDGSLFGNLKKVLTSAWRKNPDNFIIKISTPYSNSIWQIFSTYQTPDTNDYIQTDFSNDDEFASFLDNLRNRSDFDYHVNLSPTDRILTLSTCATPTSSDKIVVHAKLVRSQKR